MFEIFGLSEQGSLPIRSNSEVQAMKSSLYSLVQVWFLRRTDMQRIGSPLIYFRAISHCSQSFF